MCARPRLRQNSKGDPLIETAHAMGRSAKLLHMLIVLLIVLLLVIGGGGFYMGPGVGYYGGGAIDLILAIVIIYLIFGRGRTRI